MQRLKVSGAVRPLYGSLGVKGLKRTLGNGLGKLWLCDGLYYLSRVDHVPKMGDRKQRRDIGKYSFVNRTVKK